MAANGAVASGAVDTAALEHLLSGVFSRLHEVTTVEAKIKGKKTKVFTGASLVDWLRNTETGLDRSAAVAVGRALVESGAVKTAPGQRASSRSFYGDGTLYVLPMSDVDLTEFQLSLTPFEGPNIQLESCTPGFRIERFEVIPEGQPAWIFQGEELQVRKRCPCTDEHYHGITMHPGQILTVKVGLSSDRTVSGLCLVKKRRRQGKASSIRQRFSLGPWKEETLNSVDLDNAVQFGDIVASNSCKWLPVKVRIPEVQSWRSAQVKTMRWRCSKGCAIAALRPANLLRALSKGAAQLVPPARQDEAESEQRKPSNVSITVETPAPASDSEPPAPAPAPAPAPPVDQPVPPRVRTDTLETFDSGIETMAASLATEDTMHSFPDRGVFDIVRDRLGSGSGEGSEVSEDECLDLEMEGKELVLVYSGGPLLVPDDIWKQFQAGHLFYKRETLTFCDNHGRILARLLFSYAFSSGKPLSPCPPCAKGVPCAGGLRPVWPMREEPAPVTEAMEAIRRASQWKQALHASLRRRDVAQFENYKCVLELRVNRQRDSLVDVAASGSADDAGASAPANRPRKGKRGRLSERWFKGVDWAELLPMVYERLQKNGKLGYIEASDGCPLAYYYYEASGGAAKAMASVVVLGALGPLFSMPSRLAEGLASDYPVNAYFFLTRGTGKSGGLRSDAFPREQLYMDARSAVRFVRWNHPDQPIFLGSWSAGAGLVLNYARWPERETVSAYFFVSPVAREMIKPEKRNMTRKDKLQLKVYKSSKGRLAGSMIAIDFRGSSEDVQALNVYPRQVFVSVFASFVVNHLDKALAHVDRPFAMVSGLEDEVLLGEPMKEEFERAPVSEKHVELLEGESHTSIVESAVDPIGQWITRLAPQLSARASPATGFGVPVPQ